VTLPLPVSAKEFQVAYDAVEDRITLTCRITDAEVLALFLTRRLSEKLVNGLGAMLTNSSPLAQRTPPTMRHDVVMMEHHSAVAAPPAPRRGASVQQMPLAQHGQGHLVNEVQVTVNPHSWIVVFRDRTQVLMRFEAAREDMHRLLDLIKRTSAAANWALRIDVGWLAPGTPALVLN
jgi:hypothetical protein